MLDLHPFLASQALVIACIDEFAQREEAKIGPLYVVPSNLLEHLRREERHLAAKVWKPTMGGSENQSLSMHSLNARTRMLTLYFRYCSRRSSGIARSSWIARLAKSSPDVLAIRPCEDIDVIRPRTA